MAMLVLKPGMGCAQTELIPCRSLTPSQAQPEDTVCLQTRAGTPACDFMPHLATGAEPSLLPAPSPASHMVPCAQVLPAHIDA